MGFRLQDTLSAEDRPRALREALRPDRLSLTTPSWIKTIDNRMAWISECLAEERYADSRDDFVYVDTQLFPRSTCAAFRAQDRLVVENRRPYWLPETSPDSSLWYETLKLPIYDLAGRIIATFGVAVVLESSLDALDDLRARRSVDEVEKEVRGWLGIPSEDESLRPPRWLWRLRRLIDQRFRRTMAAEKAARDAGVSPDHATRAFRRYFGCSVSQYWLSQRAAWAREQILTTDKTDGAIAFAAGYADQSHFVRAFKREVGVTPGRFRSEVAARH